MTTAYDRGRDAPIAVAGPTYRSQSSVRSTPRAPTRPPTQRPAPSPVGGSLRHVLMVVVLVMATAAIPSPLPFTAVPVWAGPLPLPTITVWRGPTVIATWTAPPSLFTRPAATSVWPSTVPGAQVTTTTDGTGTEHLDVDIAPKLGATSTTVDLPLGAGDRVVGLGERFGGLDLRGRSWNNQVADQAGDTTKPSSYSPTPFLLSSAGYALAVDTAYPAVFDIGAVDPDLLAISLTDPNPHLTLLSGGSPTDILTRRAVSVGLPPLPPAWGLGVWKNLIGGTDRVDADAARLRAAGVPFDAVWIYDAMDETSGFGWRWPIYAQIPPGTYPDLPRVIAGFHRDGVHVLGYTAPFVYVGSPSYTDAVTNGYLLCGPDGRPELEEFDGTSRGQIDFSNPAATAWYAERVAHALTVTGFDGAMQDYGEEAPADARYASGVAGAAEHNAYPLRYAQAVTAAAATATPAKPDQTVFFARSGATGTQHLATARFTGDQQRSWDPDRGLPSALHAMLSGSVSGWPYWGPDIAGFLQTDTDSDGGQTETELWTRWVQLGALSPVMRDMLGAYHHAVDALTDDNTLTMFRAYARLHTALEPYLLTQAELAHTTGTPIVRPLFLTSPTDPQAWAIDDEYTLGDDILVAPVLQPGDTSRRLYLPPGAWRDYWTTTTYTGPGWITVAAPVQQIPLLTRSGTEPGLPDPVTLWQPPANPGS